MPETRTRRARLPISCEPCRARKIRCTRDDAPCSTCVQRAVQPSLCYYKMRHPHPNESPAHRSSASALSPPPSRHVQAADDHLAARVAKLERLLETQTQTTTGDGAPPSPSTSPRTRLDGQARPPGRLRTTPSGHVRYVPASFTSGLGDGRGAETECNNLLDSLEGPFPLGTPGGHEAAACLDALPPFSLCTRLKDIFFVSFAPLFHVLHDISFHHQYLMFEENANSAPLAWLALLYAILGTAVIAVEPDSEILAELSRQTSVAAKIDELSQRYRTAAMRCLQADNFLWQHNVTTLQALIILIYGISHSHGQSWSLLGLAHQIALSIGCHVDSSGFGLDSIQYEERRRCWAGLAMLYTTQNAGLGHLGPSGLFSNHSVLPPADVDDKDLVADSDEPPPRHSDRATQMSYLLLKFRLYDICSNICTNILAVQDPSTRTMRDLDQTIAAEQQHFRVLYMSHSRHQPLPAHHQAHYHILNGYSHQLLLLLHRPFLRASPCSGNLKESRTRCVESAKSLLDIHARFHESADFAPFKWYHRGLGSFHAFHAVVTLLSVALLVPGEVNYRDICLVIRSCLGRFEAMGHLSLICHRAIPVTRHLLNLLQSTASSSVLTPDSGILSHHASHLENRATSSAQNPTTSITVGSPSMYYQRGSRDTQQHQPHDDDAPQAGQGSYATGSGHELSDPLEFLLDQRDPQEWLTPTTIPWVQWDEFVTSSPGVVNNAMQ